mmetsp:Transcript_131238/g.185189  ORF Transcript_131238/g.185189 Transcript_131238/m.185189 type:complete len:200 (+) Transcript_131238:234-833(+)
MRQVMEHLGLVNRLRMGGELPLLAEPHRCNLQSLPLGCICEHLTPLAVTYPALLQLLVPSSLYGKLFLRCTKRSCELASGHLPGGSRGSHGSLERLQGLLCEAFLGGGLFILCLLLLRGACFQLKVDLLMPQLPPSIFQLTPSCRQIHLQVTIRLLQVLVLLRQSLAALGKLTSIDLEVLHQALDFLEIYSLNLPTWPA